MKTWLAYVLTVCLMLLSMPSSAKELPSLRLGVLKFGTVNWELDVIKHHKLDEKHGFSLDITPLGGKKATHVALQGEAVDMIVSDWIWVARQRSAGHDYTFSPYSNAVGALMLPADSQVKSLADLQEKRIGIAGGALDKTWLLLRAYSRTQQQQDLVETAKPQFAAPPLLNELAQRGELEAVVNFWHYTAMLKAAGFNPLLDVPTILQSLGVERPIPLIGWVFNEGWAAKNSQLAKAFLQASYEAKQLMLNSDEEWERLRSKLRATDEKVFVALREGFRAGIPRCFGEAEIQAATRTFKILADVGGNELTGKAEQLADGTFWSGFNFGRCEVAQ